MMKRSAVVVIASTAIAMLAHPAAADHTHVRQVGNGGCVILAVNGGEKFVELPNADDFPPNRRHPLHTKVHLGRPGVLGTVAVLGSAADPCASSGDYLND